MLSERQQQIIEASIGLIDKNGIQGFTIKNLAREIGISEPGIYRHFENKVMILGAILDTFKQQMDEYHKRSENGDDIPAEKQIKEFFGMIFRLFKGNPALVSVIFAEEIFQNEPVLTQKVLEIQNGNERMIKEMVKKLSLNHKMTNTEPEMLTVFLFGSVRHLVRKWKMSQYQFNLLTRGNKLIETTLNLMT